MFLTAGNLFYYLQDVGLITAGDVLDGEFGITEVGRRNRNFRVAGAGSKALFVKQVPAVINETVLSIMREAAFAQLAARAAPGSAMAVIGPRLRRYDPRQQVLVYDALEGESLSETMMRRGEIPGRLPEALAQTLAAIHLETMKPGALSAVATVMTGESPWIFQVGDKAETFMPQMSGGWRKVVDSVRRTPELLRGLTQLGRQWRQLCLIHGDMKADNIFLAPGSDGARELRILDWELANVGDPLWDVAGCLCMFQQNWLFSLSADALTQNASPPPDEVKTNATRFWSAYLDAMRPASFEPGEATRLVGQFAGARLVLLAFEMLPQAADVSPHAAIALQLARYFLLDPSGALKDLLGVTEPSPSAQTTPNPAPWKLAPEANSP